MGKFKKNRSVPVTKDNSKNKSKPGKNRKTDSNRKGPKTGKWKQNNVGGKRDGKKNRIPKDTDKEASDSDFEVVDSRLTDKNYAEKIKMEDESDSDQEYKDTRKWVTAQNRKKKKSGGFQSMGLSHTVYKGIIRKGYKIPTPIQRKTVPVILDGKDVVAMARTGSGKTAAFLIPMFEKLKSHTAKAGARALILSPTRELALQTLKFTKELGKFTGLKAAVILGGDRMEDQFSALHENPDIVIATPGRLLHVLVEMNLKLKAVEYVVFDEADRLFEMGFQEQLHEIINRLPDSRQTLLFSATLPKQLVEFAKAGLHDPTLIRLDVETKLSELLKLSFFNCREDDKSAILLHFLKHVINPDEQTVVFTATKHHVEYLNMVLLKAGISCTYIYSSLDQAARKINVAKFQHKKVNVMIVTDLAARGIDIPLLDNVINYNFPAKAKLFVHRVGRVARAGRSGTAYTLLSQEEIPFLLDLYVFLGRSLKVVPAGKSIPDEDGLLGIIPQTVIDDMEEELFMWLKEDTDLANMKRVSNNALKKYVKSRPAPATESIKRFKEMIRSGFRPGTHPLFASDQNADEKERVDLLQALKCYKANTTVFEVNSTSKTKAFEIMKLKRGLHEGVIQKRQAKIEELSDQMQTAEEGDYQNSEKADENDVQEAFNVVIGSKRKQKQHLFEPNKKKRKNDGGKDEEYFLHYRPTDFQSEKGLSLGSTFDKDATSALLDVSGTDDVAMKKPRSNIKWDRKKKKFVNISEQQANKKKIRTESGAVISATYKTNAYKEWRERNKMDTPGDDDDDNDDDEDDAPNTRAYPQGVGGGDRFKVTGTRLRRWHTKGMDKEKDSGDTTHQHSHKNKKGKKTFKKGRRELKRPEQIMKARRISAQKKASQKHREHQNQKHRTFSQQMSKKKKR